MGGRRLRRGSTLARPRPSSSRRDRRAQSGVRRKHAMKPRPMDPRRRHQRREPRDEVQGFQHDVRRSISVGSLEPKGMNEERIGTGPWRVREHTIGKVIKLARNLSYFRDGPKSAPALATAEIRFIPDPQTRVAEVVAGGVDLITDIGRDQAEQLRGRPRLRVATTESVTYTALRMNARPDTPAPALRDVRVRQAMMHSIDRRTIAEQLLGEHSRVLDTDCVPSLFGCETAGVRHYEHDPERARTLLANAGFPNGLELGTRASCSSRATTTSCGCGRWRGDEHVAMERVTRASTARG
jgi:hypothetical protein